MQSMTGFGEGVAADERMRVHLELRSVNHRYLDLKARVPDQHRALESELVELLRRRVRRGRVEARLEVEAVGDERVRLRLRHAALEALSRELGTGGLPGFEGSRVRLGEALRLPGMVEVSTDELAWDEAAGRLLQSAAAAALDQLDSARSSEGERLAEMLAARLAEIEEVVERLEARREEVSSETRDGLAGRLADLLGDASIPPERLALEAALLVEKSDVREELDRLTAHIAHFRELAARPGSIGKRLDFLSQELLRELNTVGSKCRDADMAHEVIRGKLACEQLREQVQNVE